MQIAAPITFLAAVWSPAVFSAAETTSRRLVLSSHSRPPDRAEMQLTFPRTQMHADTEVTPLQLHCNLIGSDVQLHLAPLGMLLGQP